MLPRWNTCWDPIDYVTYVLAIVHSMYSEGLIEQLWAGFESSIYMDGFSFAELL